MIRSTNHAWPAVFATTMMFASLTAPCAAQNTSPSTAPSAASSKSGAEPSVNRDDQSRGGGDDNAFAMFHAPLLREGSHLVEAKGRLKREQAHSGWTLAMDPTSNEPGVPGYELTVLPCTRLAEMIRILESTPNQQVTFQVTGRVLVFRNRNYVLPTHASVMTEHQTATTKPTTIDAPSPGETAPPPATLTDPASSTTGEGAATKPESAESIMKELEHAPGPIARSSAPPDAPPNPKPNASPNGNPNAISTSTRRENPEATSSSAAGATNKPDRLMQENTSIAGRRGKLTRDSSGGWMFVFDADASGLVDPPVRLLPCLLLEKIEDYARRMGNNSPALLSGAVYLYGGQNFLLPTVFRIPQDRRNLTP